MMPHRYPTRSSTPTVVIDLTQGLPSVQTRRRNLRRHSLAMISAPNPLNGETVREEMIVEILDDSVQDDRQMNTGDKATTLSCVNNSFSGIPEIITCSICFEAISASREPMATQCGHIFCGGCLSLSLKNWKRCPICQATAKLSTSIRLYI